MASCSVAKRCQQPVYCGVDTLELDKCIDISLAGGLAIYISIQDRPYIRGGWRHPLNGLQYRCNRQNTRAGDILENGSCALPSLNLCFLCSFYNGMECICLRVLIVLAHQPLLMAARASIRTSFGAKTCSLSALITWLRG